MADSSEEHAGFEIQACNDLDSAVIERIKQGLGSYNRSQIPDKGYAPVLLTLVAEDGTFLGGLSGHVSSGWLFVELLWVADAARGKGQGSNLMLAAERMALSYGARHAWVDTFSFQARDFYEKLGYVAFGELGDYPPGHSRYFLRKQLTASELKR